MDEAQECQREVRVKVAGVDWEQEKAQELGGGHAQTLPTLPFLGPACFPKKGSLQPEALPLGHPAPLLPFLSLAPRLHSRV